ncbi:unknown similar to AMEV203 [Choristoneura rosaceana entomopoxvirus 'L']|uniref:N1R/p28-like protein n=1 Tax=Choristoneura rosaceana entomopoxvirus 'L' TaxID=1293539 RepID=A0ABM9QKN0_9POXV|nr:unknown similar to AMEV203 [Choristoneura rosaceana entomopoxvirus 'L']CCU56103.1 unknown similar to AMEV203 [Choristoneura rosaceana entomopoxvirus 'L']
MARYEFDMNYNNINIITSESNNCNNCVKNFTDMVMASNENENVNDEIVNKFLNFVKTHKINYNIILDNEVKYKLYK